MLLEIANDEAQELKWALDIRLVEMRGEVVRASDHAYRDDLKNSLIRLERVAQRLDQQLTKSGIADAPGEPRDRYKMAVESANFEKNVPKQK